MDLTPEQLQKAETMPLTDLRTLILTPAELQEEIVVVKDDKPSPVVNGETDKESSDAPTVYRKEIKNGDTVDVYEADSLQELVEKIAAGKEHLNQHLRTVIQDNRALKAKTEQVSTDDEFRIAEQLKTNPKKTVEELVNEVLEKRTSAEARATEIQTRFVNSHPDYVPNVSNGNRLVAQVRLLGYQEFTTEGLEQAYLQLKADGLLALKSEGTEATPVSTPTVTPTANTEASTPETRSPRRSSTISTRSVREPAPVDTKPTEDAAYSMPLDKLRELAARQLAGNQ